jgi:nucleoside 2-deoxyribosyltransferase
MTNPAVQSTIDSFKAFYTIILALAIGESFKQFVADKNADPKNSHIQWDRLPALLSFLFLVVPFYHGMLRYFFDAYGLANRPSHYALRLSFDCLAFTFEAFLFFALSRVLLLVQWRRFYTTVVVLFMFDAAWVIIDRATGGHTILNWAYLDLGCSIILWLILSNSKDYRADALRHALAWIPVFLILLRTFLDYELNNSFYFPLDQAANSLTSIAGQKPSMASNTRRIRVYFAGPLFTQAEWQWNQKLAEELRKLNLEVTLPQKGAEPMLKGYQAFEPHALFSMNTSGIDDADLVLAILDHSDPDSGTCWECGYAYKMGHPIIGLRTDIRRSGDDPNASVNLMLSQSCKQLIQLPLEKIDDLPWIAQHVSGAVNQVVHR